MDVVERKKLIESGKIYMGMELGSTRIKAVLIDLEGQVLETGGYDWENQLEDGIWTYELAEVWKGIRECYQDLRKRVRERYNTSLKLIKAIGISGMMHGYLPFDKEGNQLAPFRTWRNNITSKAARELTDLFGYNIPQRWSIAHLYHSVIQNEEHVSRIDYLTTLAGYVHWKLTGKRIMGVGEASGMFPIDMETKDFNSEMLDKFDNLVKNRHYPWKIREILPEVLVAGECAGYLTEEGANLLDVSGELQAGCPLCPPEGDAGTGMVATNSVAEKTGNVSAGTSAFAMVVLEKELTRVYEELDMVTTPSGSLVAMAHSNNCTTDINTWMSLFDECLKAFGMEVTKDQLYSTLLEQALQGDPDCGNLLSYCFHSGEHVVGLSEGCPLFVHPTKSNFNLPNFIRTHLYTCFGAMKIGMDILIKKEKVQIEKILAHGGLFKTKRVAQRMLSAVVGVPVEVVEHSGEGGAWGMALLAAYMMACEEPLSLENYLSDHIFAKSQTEILLADCEEMQGYEKFMRNYRDGLVIEQAALAAIQLNR